MKRKMFLAMVSIVAAAASTLACGLPGGGIGEIAPIATSVAAHAPGEFDVGQDSTSIEIGDDQFEMTSGQLPAGYPEREIPIYEPATSTILGASRIELDGTVSYNVVIGSNDDVQTVTQAIVNFFENQSAEFENMMEGFLVGTKDGWEYGIVINSGEADGYETLITYSVQAAR